MRTVSFGHRLRLEFGGNVNTAAIAVGDVDNDQNSELVVGNIHGDLAIFKYAESSLPWRIYKGLGTITAVAIGDLRNDGKNSIVCITAEGFCFLFDLHSPESAGSSGAETTEPFLSPVFAMRPPQALGAPTFRLPVPVNISRILIASFEEGGRNVLILGRTDRVVHVYELQITPLSAVPFLSAATTQNGTALESATSATNSSPYPAPLPPVPLTPTTNLNAAKSTRMKPSLSVNGVPGKPPINATGNTTTSNLEPLTVETSNLVLPPSATIVVPERATLLEKQKWQFSKQLGSMAVGRDRDGRSMLVIAQPGGTYVAVYADGKIAVPEQTFHDGKQDGNSSAQATTELVGIQSLLALCTMDGAMKLLDTSNPDLGVVCWETNLNRELFAMAKLSGATAGDEGSEHDVVVACSWDGNTFFVDPQQHHVLHFCFPERRVCAFTGGSAYTTRECGVEMCGRHIWIGMYALVPGQNIPCLFYVTFHDELFVYYNISQSSLGTQNFQEELARRGMGEWSAAQIAKMLN